MKRLILAGVVALMLPTLATADSELRSAIASDYEQYLEPLFIHFHQNPELSFREFKTAERLAKELRALGVEVTEGVGQTGLVGMIRNGSGPLVLVRADMDGLPVQEQSGLSYASKATQEDIDGVVKPVMHACGHDVHITSLVGTARQLLQRKDRWSGTVMLIAQPAEERISGAKAMLEDGLYQRFGVPDYALAFHVSAGEPAGKVALESGLIGASSDSVDITVYGIGSHGASPHRGKDPIYIAAQIVVALQGFIGRELGPLEPGVITVGSFHGGFKHNIVPDEARLQLTVRADKQETREMLLAGIERVARGVALTSGLPEELMPKVEYGFESTPANSNNPALAGRLREVFVEALGQDGVYRDVRQGMGAEDFAYFAQTEHRVPSAYFSVGGTSEDDLAAEREGRATIAPHHSPFFKVEPRPAVTSATEAMTLAVFDLLSPR